MCEITVCIRSVGERTFRRLIDDVGIEFGSRANVHFVEGLSLPDAIDRCFQVALDYKSDWLVTLDADIVLKSNFHETVIDITKSMDVGQIEAHALTVDRLFFEFRSAGNRIYRGEKLDYLRALLKSTRDLVRPEGAMLRKAQGEGYKIKASKKVIGLHDFFQGSADLFRKGYLCSRKHLDNVDHLLPLWNEMAKDNLDYRVLLMGFGFGIMQTGGSNNLLSPQELNSAFKELRGAFVEQEVDIPEEIDSFICETISCKRFDMRNKLSMSNVLRRVRGRLF